MVNRFQIKVLSFFFVISALLPAFASADDTLRIAAASNFQHTLNALHVDFEAQTGVQLSTSFASSGKLFAQISHGAPFDVFLSADTARPQRLVEIGLAEEESRLTYAIGIPAFWSPQANRFSDEAGVRKLLENNSARYAIANPRLAPYGAAAKEVLADWAVAAQTITAESVSQAFQYAMSGAVDGGFVAYSQVLQWQQQKSTDSFSLWLPESHTNTAVAQQAVALSASPKLRLARAYLRYLQSARGREIIKRAGYEIETMQANGKRGAP